jgi:hypothetical protein
VKEVFEPKSATTAERFDALKTLRNAGLYGGVMATPMIPGIGDTYENMRALAKEAKQANAEFILFSGMTLKPGRQKDLFMRVVKRRFPDKYDYLYRLYAKDDRYGHADYTVKQVRSMLRGYEVCKEIGISDRTVRHQIPYEPDMNNRVLGAILDILFYQSYLLGFGRPKSKPLYELAARLERGCPDLVRLRDDGLLKETLLVDDGLLSTVLEIMDKGTCELMVKTHEMIQEVIEKSHIK